MSLRLSERYLWAHSVMHITISLASNVTNELVGIMSLYVLMYQRLFGVPDVITDMTRSLEMVET